MWQVLKTVMAALGFAGQSGFVPANFTLPAFCNNLDCPVYTVLESHQGYELRQYLPSRWASAERRDADSRAARTSTFWRLFKFIGGANDKNQKIDMTVPVIGYYQTSSPDMKNMSFFVPFANQADPPNPTDESVYRKDMPLMNVYVRTFGGYANSDKSRQHLETLKAAIGDASKYQDNFYYTAGYDSPWKFLNRHNEVWLLATN